MVRHENSESNIYRLSNLEAAQRHQPLSERDVERIRSHLDNYIQIERDNPRLIWLYSLMLEEDVRLPDATIVSAMKQAVLAERQLGPMAWRFLAKGTSSDFRIVLDAEVDDEPQSRWNLLCTWLEVLSGLRLPTPMPAPIQALFLHDNLAVLPEDDSVLMRGAWMKFRTLRNILDEAGSRLAQGTLEQFARADLPDVLVWLATVDPDLDTQQLRAGWTFLCRRAAMWKRDSRNAMILGELTWPSPVSAIQLGSWRVVQIDNAWSLVRLAISQRHCVNRFVEECLRGDAAVFAVEDPSGKTKATIKLSHDGHTWYPSQVKGFANSEVSRELEDVARLVSRQCNADKGSNVEWKKIAESEGDYLWVSGEKGSGSEIAIISREMPTSDARSHRLMALLAQLDVDEWTWFE